MDTEELKPLLMEGNLKCPKVVMDPQKGLIEFSGRSTPENTENLYRPLIKWIESYVRKPLEKTIVNLNFEYLNSSSSKYLIRFLDHLRHIEEQGCICQVNWYYDDEEFLEYGQDFEDVSNLKFNYIPVS